MTPGAKMDTAASKYAAGRLTEANEHGRSDDFATHLTDFKAGWEAALATPRGSQSPSPEKKPVLK